MQAAVEAAMKAKDKADAAANAAVAELAKTKQELNALKSKRLDGHQVRCEWIEGMIYP